MINKIWNKFLSTEKGNALMSVMVAAVAVGAGALLLTQTGGTRMKMNADVTQNTLIENTMFEIKTYLADDMNCKLALDSGFKVIGPYSEGEKVGNNVSIETITDQNPGARTRTIIFLFNKLKSDKSMSRKPDKVQIQTYEIPDPADPTRKITTCSSFETVGVNASLEKLCLSLGGAFDSNTGNCAFDFGASDGFSDDLDRLACEVLGGAFSGGTCTQINIAGSIQSNHFTLNQIDLGGAIRTDSPLRMCGDTQVATGVNPDGTVTCTNITCPQPPGDSSRYAPRVVGGNLFCECNRDRGSKLDCGVEDPDPNACNDRTVDDGCGTGNTCTIRRHRSICPRVASCGETVRDQCNRVCSVGAPCPPPPPPPPVAGPSGGNCTLPTTRTAVGCTAAPQAKSFIGCDCSRNGEVFNYTEVYYNSSCPQTEAVSSIPYGRMQFSVRSRCSCTGCP